MPSHGRQTEGTWTITYILLLLVLMFFLFNYARGIFPSSNMNAIIIAIMCSSRPSFPAASAKWKWEKSVTKSARPIL